MGNFEKVVVLLILSVCAIVLVISLRPAAAIETLDIGEVAVQRQPPVPEGGIVPSDGDATANERASPELAPKVERPKTTPGEGLLSSLVEVPNGRKIVLVRDDHLRKTLSPDFFMYTCRPGDTWLSLAKFYYGDGGRADLLSDANESLDSPVPERQILVPVYDLVLEGAHRERVEPREVPEFRLYEVQSGDTLSSISKAMYGTGARWMQIFDANRDVLTDPDALVVGARIRVPHK